MSVVRVAAVQAEVAPDLASGLERVRSATAEAAASGAVLVAFGETYLPGYPVWLDVCRDVGLWDHAPVQAVYRRMAEQSVVVPGPVTDALGGTAREHGVVLAIGVTERVERGPGRGTLYNALLVFGPDGVLRTHHRKLVPTHTERLVWGPGDGAGIAAIDSPAGRVGGLICWEHWMPLARQALHEAGEDIHIAVWPAVKEMHAVASRHYAFEGRCWVLAVGSVMRAGALPPELERDPARVAGPDAWVLDGGSLIIDPDGQVVAGPVRGGPAIVFADIDPGRVRETGMTLDVTGHYHRPDVFRLARGPGSRRERAP